MITLMSEKKIRKALLPCFQSQKLSFGLIRPATMADSSELCRLQHLAMADYAKQLGSDVILEALDEDETGICLAIQADLVFILEKKGQVLASIRLSVFDARYRISRFFVDPALQGQGIGRALFSFVLDYIHEQVHGSAWLEAEQLSTILSEPLEVELFTALCNERKAAFYQRCGFELKETTYDRGYARGRFIYQIPLACSHSSIQATRTILSCD